MPQDGFESGLGLDSREDVAEPPRFKVILHNDDFTTMDFVIDVLMSIFSKSMIESTRLMLMVHRQGRAVVGTYTYDIAATKVEQVSLKAKKAQFPLLCTLEEA